MNLRISFFHDEVEKQNEESVLHLRRVSNPKPLEGNEAYLSSLLFRPMLKSVPGDIIETERVEHLLFGVIYFIQIRTQKVRSRGEMVGR